MLNPHTGLRRRHWSKFDVYTSRELRVEQPTHEQLDSCIVLVHLGTSFPFHIYECLQQLNMFRRHTRIIFVASSHHVISFVQHVPNVECVYYDDATTVKTVEKVQPSGLFSYSIVRFYAIEHVMKMLKISKCIHIEHDNLVYAPLETLFERCDTVYGEKLGISKDSVNRAIGGFMWIGSVDALQAYLQFIESENFNCFEMVSLNKFLSSCPDHSDQLPVVPNGNLAKHFDEMRGIFDAASYGQWEGGIDVIHSTKDTRGFVNETAEYNPDHLPLHWSTHSSYGRLPCVVYDSVYVPVYNLHVHSKMLHLYVSKPWSDASEIVQGEKFRAFAQVQIHNEQDTVSKVDECNSFDPVLIYVKSDFLDAFFASTWPKFTSRCVLISHNADHGVEEHHVQWLNDPKLIHWFGQNCNIDHVKLQEIPIGLANSEWPHGNIPLFLECINTFIRKSSKLYANFADTHSSRPILRQYIRDNIAADMLVPSNTLPPAEYWKTLKRTMFVACPRGNGLDCHRLWESWYASSVPVTFDDASKWRCIFNATTLPKFDFTTKLPEWNESEYHLWKRATGRKELRMSYWKALISQKLHVTLFDVCIVVHPKDFGTLSLVVEHLQRFAYGCRNIYIVTSAHSSVTFTSSVDVSRVQWIDEVDVAPCTKSYVESLGFGSRTGWYFQQLLKLNLDALPNVLDRVLIVDADTVLCKPCTFWDGDSGLFQLFTWAEPFYQQFARRVLPTITHHEYASQSAVVHHMPIYVPYLRDMKHEVVSVHNTPFHDAFLRQVLPMERKRSGASEYQLYFDYCLQRHPSYVKIRLLKQSNDNNYADITSGVYDLVSLHSYLPPKNK